MSESGRSERRLSKERRHAVFHPFGLVVNSNAAAGRLAGSPTP
jgi:hypothetical protein